MRDRIYGGDETVARRILRPALRYVFGDDFFVTYGRADGAAYAAALANRLVGAGYTCYLDQWQPGLFFLFATFHLHLYMSSLRHHQCFERPLRASC